MSSVPYPPQPSAHAVVAGSHWAPALALSMAVASWSLPALADSPGAARAPASQDEPPAARENSYRGLLGTSYVLAPFLAAGVGYLISESELDDGLAVIGAGAMFFTPAVVHMAHGHGVHGPLSFLGLAATTGVGVVVGGLIGSSLDALGCDPAEDSDGCSFAGLMGLIVGGVVGGFAGYTGFAVYDVAANGAVPVNEAPAPSRASLQLWLRPLPAAKTERAEATPPFAGLQIGAILQM